MKLKHVLILAFLTLTLIPIIVVSLLLYKSGYDLSQKSYTRNLTESITVQENYIAQTIDNNMISDFRFAQENQALLKDTENASDIQEKNLHTAFQAYLKDAEDKITVCFLLDKENNPLYTIGDTTTLETVKSKLPPLSELGRQTILEFELEPKTYSLGIVTPIWDSNNDYTGCLISIYDQSFLFKIISSYYKIADTSTYICRANGDVINYRELSDEKQNIAIEKALIELTFTTEGVIDMRSENMRVSGYYKNIDDSPWYLVGFIDDTLVYSFTNQYVLTYILIILGVAAADMLLAIYFSQKVVGPINNLIRVMEGYPNTLTSSELQIPEKNGYYETRYLRTKFLALMKRIMLIQHNFEGVYQLYQSGDMSDTNIDIDVIEQTISSNKEVFQTLMDQLQVPSKACIVERFTCCFCNKDQQLLMNSFENMRDRHLSVPCEIEAFTPHLGKKWFHTLVVPMYENDRLSHLFVQLRDITSFKKQEIETMEESRRDSLTGLYNRAGFTKYVNDALQTGDNSSLHALLFIDMDYFKMVNDNMGHSAGDELLRSVGIILQDNVRPGDIVSRFGGDEFAIFLPHTSHNEIEQIKEALCKGLVYPFHTDKISFVVTASIGVSLWKDDSKDTLEELLQQADAAMYQAKKRVKESTGKKN